MDNILEFFKRIGTKTNIQSMTFDFDYEGHYVKYCSCEYLDEYEVVNIRCELDSDYCSFVTDTIASNQNRAEHSSYAVCPMNNASVLNIVIPLAMENKAEFFKCEFNKLLTAIKDFENLNDNLGLDVEESDEGQIINDALELYFATRN